MNADPTILRMIDANANRAREALRVMEDYARFALNDAALCGELKGMRHALAEALSHPALADAILSRDTPQDVGTTIKTAAELTRDSLAGVVIAAGKRLSESLRVLEECAKALAPEAAQAIEPLRYRGYTIEQFLSRFAGGAEVRARFAQVRLYVLLTESLCHPAVGGWEKMLDAILAAAAAPDQAPGAMPCGVGALLGMSSRLCVQLREKNLPDSELLRRGKILAAKCRHAGAVSIINDRPDIALLAGADGVHLGQEDLPCAEVRKLAGQHFIIGISTERTEQARRALADGATYIAAGPMFLTATKEKPRLAGPAYAAEALREIPLPVVAIGGISAENLPQLGGIRAVAVCNAIIAQPDPAAAARRLMTLLAP